jgi:hypothetical protein
MLLPISLIVLVLFVAMLGGLYVVKKRAIDREHPPDLRPDDPPRRTTQW